LAISRLAKINGVMVSETPSGVAVTDVNTDSLPAHLPARSPGSPTPPTGHPEPATGGGNQLTRVTVNLTPRAIAALDRMAGGSERRPGRSASPSGMTRTELINRGVQVLEVIERMLERDNGALTVKHQDGSEETVYIL
jgi:hypothetical protein